MHALRKRLSRNPVWSSATKALRTNAASPEAPLATRTRSRTPTKSDASPAAAKENNRRRSSRGASALNADARESLSLEAFLEEMGIRFLTNAKANKRKSSVLNPVQGIYSSDFETMTIIDKLRDVSILTPICVVKMHFLDTPSYQVLITRTEVGQIRNNEKKLGMLFTELNQDVQRVEETISAQNPNIFQILNDNDTAKAVESQKQMKLLKKHSRVKAEQKFLLWRETAQKQIEDALLRVRGALEEDLSILNKLADNMAEKEKSRAEASSKKQVSALNEQLETLEITQSEQ